MRNIKDVLRFVIAGIVLLAGAAGAAQPLVRPALQLPDAAAGETYAAGIVTILAGDCPSREITQTVIGGELPEGLQVHAGAVRGVAPAAGAYQFVLRVSSACADAVQPVRLTVTGRSAARVSAVAGELNCRPNAPKSILAIRRPGGSCH